MVDLTMVFESSRAKEKLVFSLPHLNLPHSARGSQRNVECHPSKWKQVTEGLRRVLHFAMKIIPHLYQIELVFTVAIIVYDECAPGKAALGRLRNGKMNGTSGAPAANRPPESPLKHADRSVDADEGPVTPKNVPIDVDRSPKADPRSPRSPRVTKISERMLTRAQRTLDMEIRARFITGGGYRLLASANLGELVLGCTEASKQASMFGPSQKRKEIQVSARN